MEFRDLKSYDIETRIAQQKPNGLQLLLYKNARVDMNILDETVSPEKWQRDHFECKGNLYCKVGIKCGDEWIWKADCGAESNTEAEKGEASDSFKRACVNWGIGRELYTSPFIWIKAEDYATYEKNGKQVCKDSFSVSEIEIEHKTITGLVIINNTTGKDVFRSGTCKNNKTTKPPKENKPTIANNDKTILRNQALAVAKELGISPQQLADEFRLDANTTVARFEAVVEELQKRKEDLINE